MKQKYWYITKIEFCVICGREKKRRYRVYVKPTNNIKSTEYACGEHFF